jgi:AcrR family transcriptional regulator
MRYPPERKDHTRRKLVKKSAALMRRHGFAASGVDAIARAAGLTSGAFYRHFEGKDDLLAAVVEEGLAVTRGRIATLSPGSEEQILAFVDAYLSLAHVRHAESGCVLPALAAEVGRAPAATRAVFEASFAELTAALVSRVGDRHGQIALAVVSQCVGAVMLARALATDEARLSLLAAARAGVRALLASARETRPT